LAGWEGGEVDEWIYFMFLVEFENIWEDCFRKTPAVIV
jgi:hypothetical protein